MLTLSALKLVSTINGREKLHCYSSQGGEGRKVHVFLSCRGAISFYVHVVPSGLVSIFLDVECDKISCELNLTRFFQNFL